MQKINQYSFDQHRHLFAAWCTSTSSSSSPRCRFKVKIGLEILNKSNVNGSAIEKEFALFNNQDCFDE